MILKRLFEFLIDVRGVTLVEYGIAIAVGVALGAGAFGLLAGEIGVALNAAGTRMPN